MRGTALIGQSGGPTSVINASLVGLIEACAASPLVERTIGMRFGIDGFLKEELVDLGAQDRETLHKLRITPSSALGSCRRKLLDADLPQVLALLRKYDVRWFFLIGGNDSMDTVHRVERYCRDAGYELFGVGVPKTVDNDLFGTDHTPGFPSAARFVALSVRQAGRLARDMRRVDAFVVHQTVGREAGWLAAASALARAETGDAPHAIYVPERRIREEEVIEDARGAIRSFGFCSIVCGEGVLWEDGSPVSQARERDRFSNVEFGAMGGSSAALALHALIRKTLGLRGEFQICESLAMCASDRAVGLDYEEAYACGRRAAELALGGTSGVMVAMERLSSSPYAVRYGTSPLNEVAVRAKPMPDSYLAASGRDVTPAFLEYLRPLAGDLPGFGDLDNLPVRARAAD